MVQTNQFKILHNIKMSIKDGLYQVLVNNTIPNTILDKNTPNYTILYTNTIPNQNEGFQVLNSYFPIQFDNINKLVCTSSDVL